MNIIDKFLSIMKINDDNNNNTNKKKIQSQNTVKIINNKYDKYKSKKNINNIKSTVFNVHIICPKTKENLKKIIDTLKPGHIIILNLENSEHTYAQRLIDFASGTCYACGGSLKQISTYIFILAPKYVNINNECIKNLNYNFNNKYLYAKKK